jgi:outer membrane protein OmpA-like peptidoglycan-associated protein
MQPFLLRSTFFLLLLSGARISFAQSGKETAPPADINIVVTNSKKLPLKGEEVLFTNTANKRSFTAKTDALGKCKLSLPSGSVYTIRLKTMNDTASYSRIDIPSLQPGQSFDAPFVVDIQYEPPRTYTLNKVHFDTGKPTLRPESFKELNEIAEYMKIKEDEKYEVSGHTDNAGKEEDNLKLSQQRAEAVRNYLIKKGINASRLTAKGYGATKPVADNATAEGKQQNRRTEVTILE